MLPKLDYSSPRTLGELLELLDRYKDQAKILAGGTDLIVSLREKLEKPKYIIDIKKIPELGKLEYREGEGLTIGATVTFKNILENPVIKDRYSVLWEAVKTIGDMVLRNRATLVGNICTASPAGDSSPALLVLNARVKIVSKEGSREIPLENFFTGVKKTVLKPWEMVKEVLVPEPPKKSFGRYLKMMRVRSEDLSVVGVAGLGYREGGEIKIRLAFSSVAPTPLRVKEAEEAFAKPGPIEEKIERAVQVAVEKVSPISDVRGSAEYRLNLVRVLTRRLLKQLVEVV
ncbi:MAG: xanthine dehydrogenase family protein subunit M [Aigarchaeota archaeon]|nr:xanthine dehydrogenase family protein subunit M [Aigarchaeota archaeon]MCX8192895.1 xanthine dehydrogenase family protein subunit M [Nitrososphaeria archaeon]MDW7986460.1 xanthine dehydrogenase family protein subunit M [Nitrososphaerota archaeon]